MGMWQRLFGTKPETRAAPSSWDLMRGGIDTEAGVPVAPALAENLSAVYAAVQIISETVASLQLTVLRRVEDGVRHAAPDHPVARLFGRDANERQTALEWLEQMQAHCLLRGNAYSEIRRDNRGAPVELVPLHPDNVAVLRIPRTRRVVYQVTDPEGGTRRLLPEEVFHLRDRSDDGIVGKSRLERARESFGTAIATERHAASTFRNSATLSGVFTHPEALGTEAHANLRASLETLFAGARNAGRFGVLEEGMTFQALSVSPEDAELLASRRFSVEAIARIFRVPPPLLADLSHGNYSNVVELNRGFAIHCIRPWLRRWERTIERALLSEEGRRQYEVEFDADELVAGDLLQRWQAYRIMREIGAANANEIRLWERINKRDDPDADAYLSPLNMASEQAGRPRQDEA
jgi:HK97 family phage portal protein